VLAGARVLVARLYEPSLLPLLASSGGVHAVAVDTRIALRPGTRLRETVARHPAIEVILIHEGDAIVTLGRWHSRAWPEEPAAMLALVAAPRARPA
jgi:hypothetical protein